MLRTALMSYGLEELLDNKDLFNGLIGAAYENGICYEGYSDVMYINHHFGHVQMVLQNTKSAEKDEYELAGINVHSAGKCHWRVRIKMNIDRKDSLPSEKRCVVSKLDGTEIAVMSFVNSDVIPSYDPEEIVTCQVVAFPVDKIRFFENEGEVFDAYGKDENGKKAFFAENSLFPCGLLKNRSVDSKEEKDDYLDDVMFFWGKVKSITGGYFSIEHGERLESFYHTYVDTPFGELEIVHTLDQINEEDFKNAAVGKIIACPVVIQADVAVYEHETGIVYNLENNLKLFRSSCVGTGSIDRLEKALDDDVEYNATFYNTTYYGKEATLNRLRTVQRDRKNGYEWVFAELAVVPEDLLSKYYVGELCMVLADSSLETFESIMILDLSESGRIKKITTETDGRLAIRFIDPDKNVPEKCEMPKGIREGMIKRAVEASFIKGEEDISGELGYGLSDIAGKMADYVLDNDVPRRVFEDTFSRVFEYAMVKVICDDEIEFNDDFIKERKPLTKDQRIAHRIYDAGTVAYGFEKDFSNYSLYNWRDRDPNFRSRLISAYEDVMKIACVYAERIRPETYIVSVVEDIVGSNIFQVSIEEGCFVATLVIDMIDEDYFKMTSYRFNASDTEKIIELLKKDSQDMVEAIKQHAEGMLVSHQYRHFIEYLKKSGFTGKSV